MLSDQRDENRRILLAAIRKADSIARIDVARETGISQATVTTVTAELLRDGLIEEVPQESANLGSKPVGRRGRPRVNLKLRGAAHLVAGIKLTDRMLSVVLVDFEGKHLGEYRLPLEQSVFEPEDLAPELRKALEGAVKKIGRDYNELSAVGLGLSGMIDETKGLVYWSASLSRRNVDLRTPLTAELGLPVFIDNDANLVAMAEQYFGLGQGVSDFIVVTIEAGVGMGIVLGGELYRGNRGCAAEFGHTKVHLDGALCRCGQRGCLEAYVADYALLREAYVSNLFDDIKDPAARLESLKLLARDGNAVAQSIIDRATRMFAMGLANIINIFDPQLIIISGDQLQFDFLNQETVMEQMRGSIVEVDKAPPKVLIHKWDDLMWARGAAAYALDKVVKIALDRMRNNAD